MRRYLRSRAGSCFFFTLVTHQRRPILTTELGRVCLRAAIGDVRLKHPFDITAIVLLPDHLHAIWELPRRQQLFDTLAIDQTPLLSIVAGGWRRRGLGR